MQVSKASDFVAEWQQKVFDQILAVTMYLELSRLPHDTTSPRVLEPYLDNGTPGQNSYYYI